MVDYRFNLGWVKYPVLVPGDEIVDRHRRCNLVTENGIQAQHVNIIGGIVDAVGIENFFSNCFAHNVPRK